MGAIDFHTTASPVATADLILEIFGRHLVELVIENLIERLDARDGNPDAEEGEEDCCPAGDDGVFSGTLMGTHPGWPIGSDEDEEEDDPPGGNIDDVPHDQDIELKPKYGLDQTKGPINEVDAVRDHQRAMIDRRTSTLQPR